MDVSHFPAQGEEEHVSRSNLRVNRPIFLVADAGPRVRLQYLLGEYVMGWKTPKIEYVNGYKIIEVEGPAFKVYEGDRQLGDDFPYSGEAAAHANSLPRGALPQR